MTDLVYGEWLWNKVCCSKSNTPSCKGNLGVTYAKQF